MGMLKILFAGTTENAVEVLRYLHQTSGHRVVGVLTRLDSAVGRKQVITESPVAVYARSNQLPVVKANHLDSKTNTSLKAFEADLALVVAYGTILRRETLSIPTLGWINIHFSLLPALRGAAPVQRALMAGLKETGVSVFQLDEGMDTGDLLAQVATLIGPDETAGDLLRRLTQLSLTLIDEVAAKIESGIANPSSQSGEVTQAPKLTREDAKIKFNDRAEQIENLVRGCNPEPVAWALCNGEPFRVLRARRVAVSGDTALSVGEVRLSDRRVLVGAGSGVLELIEVQPSSKKPMKALDWMRGAQEPVWLS